MSNLCKAVCSLIFVMVALNVQAQSSLRIAGKHMHELKQPLVLSSYHAPLFLFNLKKEKPAQFPLSIQSTASPKAYQYEHLGAFCKLEVQIEKKTRFPVKFRLGDVQYNDMLEGKVSELMLIR